MKIKTQITLSFAVIIILVIFSMSYFSIKVLENFANDNIEGRKIAFDAIIDKNSETTKSIIADYVRKIILIDANNLTRDLSFIFSEIPKNSDIQEIANNKKIISVMTKPGLLEQKLIYPFIIDKKGNLVFPTPASSQTENFNKIRNNSDLWNNAKNHFNKSNFLGEYPVKDENNEIVEYVIFKPIPDSAFLVMVSVDVKGITGNIHSKISSSGKDVASKSEETMRTILAQVKKHIINVSVAFAVIVLCFGLGYGVWFGNYICRPMVQLQAAIMDIQKGKVPEKLKESGTAETKMITKSFNDMTRVLTKDEIKSALNSTKL